MTTYARGQNLRQGAGTFVVIDVCKPGVVHKEAAVVVLQRDAANPMPIIWNSSAVKYWNERKNVALIELKEPERPHTVRESDRKRGDARWARIEAILGNPQLYKRETRNKLLIEHAKAVGSTKETLLDDLRRYWLNGQCKAALYGDYWRCGQLDETSGYSVVIKTAGGKDLVLMSAGRGRARGRRPLDGTYEPYVITEEVHEQILAVGRKVLFESEKQSVRHAADEVVRQLFCARSANGALELDENGAARLLPLGMRPTHEQIRYRLRRCLSVSETFKKRTVNRLFENNHDATLGSAAEDGALPGEVYEIDATIVDLWLVSKADRVGIIGKATLYLVMDRRSGLIVGFHLSLEKPCFDGARQALLSVANDWKEICKRHGVVYRESAFPAVGVIPQRLVMDRGDGQVGRSDVFCEELGLSVSNLPAYMSRLKGTVECGMRLVQTPILDHVPGATLSRQAKQRRSPKYEKDACYTFDDLYATLLNVVMTHNLSPKATREVFPEDVARGYISSPAERWTRLTEEEGVLGRVHSRAVLEDLLRPTASASVTKSGVQFMGLCYEFDEFKALDWPSIASLRGQFAVKVAYSPMWLNEITVFHPKIANVRYVAKLTRRYAQAFDGYSESELREFRSEARRRRKEGAELELAHRLALGEVVEARSAEASRLTKIASKGMSLNERKTRGAAARQREQKDERTGLYTQSGTTAGQMAAQDIQSGVLQELMASCPPPPAQAPAAAPLESTIPTALSNRVSKADALAQASTREVSKTDDLLADFGV